jgi:aldehyde dehydrogenase (NAD+)
MRHDDLRALAHATETHTDALLDALQTDLGKCSTEAYTSEVGLVLRDLRFAQKHLKRWMKDRRTGVPLMARPGRAYVHPEPLGVVLVVGPWNYPFQLLFAPLVAALAAGNAVCLKPSEFAPATAQVVRELCASAFPEDHVTVALGDHLVSAHLVSQPFDHIIFTGSTDTGRKVAESAARNLTPVTLELGGKSPCVVCADAPLARTARRILWGKCLNAGQTCVAPDYVMAHESIIDRLLPELKQAARDMVPRRPPDPDLGDYGRIVNQRHFDRLVGLMEGTTLFDGGERDRERLTLAPAILTGVGWDHPVMREEIFGPLLPVLPFHSLETLMRDMAARPKPLAAYLFTTDRSTIRAFRGTMTAGSLCINDTVSQLLPPDLPFGGVGASGYGRYRGRAGFDRFSNPKAILERGFKPDLPFRYPPYTTRLAVLKNAFRWLAG